MNVGQWLAGIEWTRPVALVALVLPLLLLLLSLRAADPPLRAVGTLAIWRKLAQQGAPSGSGRRRELPLERWLAIAALIAGSLSLAGPVRHPAPVQAPWRIVVDRSPSMYLPYGEAVQSERQIQTRLAEAWRRAAEWLAAVDQGRPRLWLEAQVPHAPPLLQVDLPAAWREPPLSPQGEPTFLEFDEAHTFWLTDRVAEAKPTRASLSASGGEAVPGWIALEGDLALRWDGQGVEREVAKVAPGRIAWTDELAPSLIEFLRLWAENRGLQCEGEGPLLLTVSCQRAAEVESLRCGRDGWQMIVEANVTGLEPELGMQPWLAVQNGSRVLVQSGPGQVQTAITAVIERSRDPALFALSWSELLDAHLLPHPAVVSLAERADAGVGELLTHRPAPELASGSKPPPIAAALALCAALCALLGGLIAMVRPAA